MEILLAEMSIAADWTFVSLLRFYLNLWSDFVALFMELFFFKNLIPCVRTVAKKGHVKLYCFEC